MTGVVESLNSAAPAYQPSSANSAASAASQQQQQGGMGVAVQGAGQQQQQGANPAQSNLPMALKAKDEILTSLHLIKDIRRLEKYQRDFFLKVKESLNHVQQLLDHQLVDMAWSDNLIDCEESLLRASVTLSASAPAQIQELYALLLQDRDRLNTRFQELSVKSSLSEYVVNSRSLLDIQTVHVATEAILRNEKPIQPKSDKAIPVDHTFFLANFCTTSVASSMFASCLPGAVNNVTSANKLAVSNASPGPYGGRYGDQSPMKANVLAANTSPRQGSSVQGPQNAKMYNAYNGNGGQSGGQYMEQAKRNASGGLPPPVQGQGAGQDDPFGGHELVAAISQITRREDTPNAVGANNATTPKKGQAPPTAASPRKADIWGAKEDGEAELNGFPGGKATPPVGTNPGNGQGNSNTEALASSAAQAVIMGDGSSESVTSESDDGRFAAQAGGGNPADFDASKPLSFARIASLNLEKQAVQRSAAAAAAAAVGNAVSANPGPILQPPQQQAPQQQQQQQQPQQQMQQQQQQQHPAPIQPQQQQQQSMGMPPVGGFGAPMLGNNGNGNGSLQQQLPSTPNLSSMPPNMQQGNAQMMGGNSMASVLAQQQQMMSMGLVAPQPQQMAQMPLINLPPTNNPRYFFDIVMEGKSLGRVIIEVEPAMAPKMAQNFGMLVTASRGFGYKGCQFFQAWKGESVICGDWEHNSGRGGRAALEGGPLFTPDETRLPCIRGAVGMRRMSKKHSSLNQVASQFRIILANMNTQFTGIFGHVVSGIEALDKVANIGGEGGRPEKIAAVSQCGIWKSS